MDPEWKVDCSDDENYGLSYSSMVYYSEISELYLSIFMDAFFSSVNNGFLLLLQSFNCSKVTPAKKTADF